MQAEFVLVGFACLEGSPCGGGERGFGRGGRVGIGRKASNQGHKVADAEEIEIAHIK